MAFEIYNTWLYRLKLEPIARFRIDLRAEGGRVNHISAALSRDTRVFPTMDSAGITEVPQHLVRSSNRHTGFLHPSASPIFGSF
jgi:hypothetical protein